MGAGFDLIRAQCRIRGLAIADDSFTSLEILMPLLLTPGAAEAPSVKVYRQSRTRGQSPELALRQSLEGYRNPVALEIMESQIRLAVLEASAASFIPPAFCR